MALYPNNQEIAQYDGAIGKTHTNLVVSEGAAPAERFIVSKTNDATPFIYEYGPEGNQTVLIAKGKIVEAVGEEMDREFRHKSTAIKVAKEDSESAIGVNHHNVYEQRRGAMEGNRPTVITRSYIEVPLFEHGTVGTAAASAKAMHFGAAYGVTDGLKSGDFVVSGIDGNFKKYVKGSHDFTQVIGQVLNVERELPPAGLLQYYTGLKNTELDTYLNQISATAPAGDAGHPYGAPYSVGAWKPAFLKGIAGGDLKGIPFLTDGYFSARKMIEAKISSTSDIESVTFGEGASVSGDVVTVKSAVTDAAVYIKMKHKIDPRDLNNVTVTTTEGTIPSRDVHVDAKNNTIVVYLDGGVTASDFSIKVASVVNPKAGIPTEWDYSGSVGAARILLLR